MLNSKLLRVDISEQLWKEMMQHIIDGVFRKLKAASKMLAIDGHVAAGLYVFAIEICGIVHFFIIFVYHHITNGIFCAIQPIIKSTSLGLRM
jgi:hypothetical protein